MTPTERRLVAYDGTPLFYRTLFPDDCRALLVVLHGMGEHGGRYARFAEWMGSRGIGTAVPDLRGFGKSGGKRAFVRSFSDFHCDVAAIHRHLERTGPRVPIFFLGHSFGGLIASSYLANASPPSVKGLVLTSPIFGIALRIPAWKHFFGLLAALLVPGHTEDNRVVPATLTHDPEILGEYAKDGLIYHGITAGLYRELVGMIARRDRIAESLRIPALILQAGEDKIVSRQDTVKFFERLASPDKEMVVYSGWYHEILNETGREEVFAKILTWLETHIL